jgi:hypothetical protein
MKKHGYIENPKSQIEPPSFKGATIQDLGLTPAITIPASV